MAKRIERQFWAPSVTSQFRICPIPFHFDTYRGCQYGCLFCFARDFIRFARRGKEGDQRRQAYITGNSPEGLKLRVISSAREKAIYSRIGEALGFDILGDFAKNGMIEGGDRCYNETEKRRMLQLYTDKAKEYGVKFFNADNLIDPRYGCSAECCGTDFLRNHKVWAGARRSLAHPKGLVASEEFGKCLVNFTRNSKNSHRTIAELCREYNQQEDEKTGLHLTR